MRDTLCLPFVWFVKLTGAPFAYPFLKLRIIDGKNLAAAKKGPVILVANHRSLLDVMALMCLFPLRSLRFLAADKIYRRNGFSAFFAKAMGMVRVSSCHADINALSDACKLLTKKGAALAVFPEGRLNRGRELLPLRPGAALMAIQTGAPILPVYLGGKYGLFHRTVAVIGEPLCSPFLSAAEVTAELYTRMETLQRKCEGLSRENKTC